MTRIFFGIDPGASGAISAIWDDGVPFINHVKLKETERDISEFVCSFDSREAFAMIERVHSSPQMGVTSAFSFGRSYGFLRGLLSALSIPYEEVSPQKWQKAMGCMTRGDKNVSKQKAQQLWPTLKITHANAESLLIAEFARRTRQTSQ